MQSRASFRLGVLENLLTVDLAAQLLGITKKKLFDYDSDNVEIPEDVLARIEFIDKIVNGYLVGAYTNDGIRQWFFRLREELDKKCPTQILSGNWNPADPLPQKALELARNINAA